MTDSEFDALSSEERADIGARLVAGFSGRWPLGYARSPGLGRLLVRPVEGAPEHPYAYQCGQTIVVDMEDEEPLGWASTRAVRRHTWREHPLDWAQLSLHGRPIYATPVEGTGVCLLYWSPQAPDLRSGRAGRLHWWEPAPWLRAGGMGESQAQLQDEGWDY